MTPTMVHRIGIAAPSGVGKTTLLASLLLDGREMLNGQNGRLTAENQAQSADLSDLINRIKGALENHHLNLGAINATIGVKNYRLRLGAGVSGPSVILDIMDYPGGIITGEVQDQNSWVRVQEHVEQSTMLLVPINAPALMSATTIAERAALSSHLAIEEVSVMVESWAKFRGGIDSEPACIMFCPIRCESYFSDHHNVVDESARLFQAVSTAYRDVWDLVRSNAPRAQIGYLPLDTLGSVSLQEARWLPNSTTGKLECQPTFHARAPYKFSPKGVRNLMVLTAKLLMEDTERQAEAQESRAGRLYREASEEVDRDRFVLWRWWLEASGQMDQMRGRAEQRRSELVAARSQLGTLRETMEFLRTHQMDSRYVAWNERR
ncbi:hypothetical protein F4553_002325 [Allocatelliglobosispora scoriae]|uniref:Uncharacterized protein n=1 Tax=Allocatelliglobosispora scoriae TaxID=643052 RepID=A0A841BNS1_9ACTN|nr:hypothetical protein [Allocatelliglobosispora scoriae]MBB5868946.1 hypothetical protein [Allocatelliglobosispora scoriae]